MKSKMILNKKDVTVTLVCIFVLLVTLGSVGSSGRRRAKEAVCLSNLRQWGTVFQLYTEDNDGFFNKGWPSEGGDDWGFAGGHTWPLSLRPYYSGLPAKHEAEEDLEAWGEKKIRFCPMATRPIGKESRAGYWAWIQPDTIEADGSATACGSYGTNEWTGNQPEGGERIEGASWRITNVQGADNIPLIMDCAWAGGFPEHLHAPPIYEGEIDMGQPEIRRFCINRHNGFVNSAFLDFSARKIGLKELWTLKWHREYDICGPWTKCGGVQPEDWPDWMQEF